MHLLFLNLILQKNIWELLLNIDNMQKRKLDKIFFCLFLSLWNELKYGFFLREIFDKMSYLKRINYSYK